MINYSRNYNSDDLYQQIAKVNLCVVFIMTRMWSGNGNLVMYARLWLQQEVQYIPYTTLIAETYRY